MSVVANARAQLFSVPPYAVATTYMCIVSYYSDKMHSRGAFVMLSASLAAGGSFLLLFVHSSNHVRYFATFCLTSGTYSVIAATNAWCKFLPGPRQSKLMLICITSRP